LLGKIGAKNPTMYRSFFEERRIQGATHLSNITPQKKILTPLREGSHRVLGTGAWEDFLLSSSC
jgi:hypothetical protein